MKIILVIAFLMFEISSIVYAQSVKIGYIDLQRVIRESQAGKSARVAIENEIKKKRDLMEQKIRQLASEKMEFVSKAPVMDSGERNTQAEEIDRKEKELRRMGEDFRDELQKRDVEITRKILNELESVIDQVGESEGFTMIVEKTEGGVIYGGKGGDLTDEVVQIYNGQKQKITNRRSYTQKIGYVDLQYLKKSTNNKSNEVEEIIREIGDSEGYDLIIEKTEGGVIYTGKDVNVTNRVTQVLKERLLKLSPEELEKRYKETKMKLYGVECPSTTSAYGYGYYKAIQNYDMGGFTDLYQTMETICKIKLPKTWSICYDGVIYALANKDEARICVKQTGGVNYY